MKKSAGFLAGLLPLMVVVLLLSNNSKHRQVEFIFDRIFANDQQIEDSYRVPYFEPAALKAYDQIRSQYGPATAYSVDNIHFSFGWFEWTAKIRVMRSNVISTETYQGSERISGVVRANR